MEVHAPERPIHTWKDFFIHIATIVVGLLIAVGLEQMVELIHHHHQVAEVRQALQMEKEQNIKRFGIQTEEYRREIPKLEENLAIYKYLKAHPGAPQSQWPGKLNWWYLTFTYNDSAWKTAQQSGVLEHMPREEVQYYSVLYAWLQRLSDAMITERDAQAIARSILVQEPDVSKLSSAQIDQQIQYSASLINAYINAANDQRNTRNLFSDFTPTPEREEYLPLLNIPSYGTDSDVAALDRRLHELEPGPHP